MHIESITSESNPLIKQVRALHQRAFREKHGLFLIEGERLVEEAFVKELYLEHIIVSERFFADGLGRLKNTNLTRLITVPDKIFKELATTTNPAGVLAIAKIPSNQPTKLFLGKKPLVVIADAIQDPGNLGTMLRTCLAASATGLIAGKGTVDLFSPKVVRSAMGASFAVPTLFDIEPDKAIEMCKERGLTIVGCAAESDQPYWDCNLNQPAAIIVGNEGQGISASAISKCDHVVSIPMSANCESLNAAQALTVILFESVRQRMSSKS